MIPPDAVITEWTYRPAGPELEVVFHRPAPGNTYDYESAETITITGDEARHLAHRWAPAKPRSSNGTQSRP